MLFHLITILKYIFTTSVCHILASASRPNQAAARAPQLNNTVRLHIAASSSIETPSTMFGTKLLTLASLLAVAHATVIQWGTCKETFNSPVRVDCGRLFVPLDYTSSDDETLSLELLRIPAAEQPAKSILLNFGGPGLPGRSSLAGLAPTLQL